MDGCSQLYRVCDEPELFGVLDNALAHNKAGGGFPLDSLVHQLPHLLGCVDGGVISLETEGTGIQFGHQLGSASQERPFGDDHTCAFDLFARLLDIAAIGKEDAPSGEKQQQPIAAGVTAQVTQVRRMRHHEAIELLLDQSSFELFQSRDMVHEKVKFRASSKLSYF